MASFSHLPNELVEDIFTYLPQPSLFSVCRLNKSLSALAIPILYQHVDLYIPSGTKVPRIDRFCYNIINDSQRAGRVESLRLGLSPDEGVKEGQRWLPQDRHFDDGLMFAKAMDAMSHESLVAAGDYLRDAIGMREYSAYAALILIVLPSLRHLHVADHKGATVDHLHTILRNLDSRTAWNHRQASAALMARLSSITTISVNVDVHGGLMYRKEGAGRSTLDHLLNLSELTTLEMSVPDGQQRQTTRRPPGHPGNVLRHQLVNSVRPTKITRLVIRHSGPLLGIVMPVLDCTPNLRSLTYDLFYDCTVRDTAEPHLVNLSAWSDALGAVKDTLELLVFSVEYCSVDLFAFQQPRIAEKLYGYLDLTNHQRLYTLEVPFPFLTGDVNFSIMQTSEIYPLFPPNLKHLSLRPDLSHAQFPFPFDNSILPTGLSFHESESEARYLMNARMDVSYMFHATLVLLDHAPNLESVSVWQPADPSLNWFDGQISDFATTCKNRSITGKVITPILLRSKKREDWNLIREDTVFDRLRPDQDRVEKLIRGERQGIPLGLATQFHLRALRSHRVRLRR